MTNKTLAIWSDSPSSLVGESEPWACRKRWFCKIRFEIHEGYGPCAWACMGPASCVRRGLARPAHAVAHRARARSSWHWAGPGRAKVLGRIFLDEMLGTPPSWMFFIWSWKYYIYGIFIYNKQIEGFGLRDYVHDIQRRTNEDSSVPNTLLRGCKGTHSWHRWAATSI